MERKNLSNEKEFYVYGIYDPKESFPFYVGKGSNGRKEEHFRPSKKGNNPHKDRKIAKIKKEGRTPNSKIIFDGLTEAEAFDKEWGMLHMFRCHSEVELTNMHYNWGEGSGCGENNPMFGKTRSMSDKTRKLMSEAHKGKTLSEEHKKKIAESNRGKSLTEKTKRKISKSHQGKVRSNEFKQKVSKAKMGEKNSQCKLTKQEAAEIKWISRNTEKTNKRVGKLYSVSISSVSSIKSERTWKHIDEEKPSNFQELFG